MSSVVFAIAGSIADCGLIGYEGWVIYRPVGKFSGIGVYRPVGRAVESSIPTGRQAILQCMRLSDYIPHKKHIPNLLSLLRVAAALPLPFLPDRPAALAVLAGFCILTDLADGPHARRVNAVTTLGARLDSLGDFVFALALVLHLVLWRRSVLVPWVIPLVAITAVRFLALGVCTVRNGRPWVLHTVMNKAAGIGAFGLLVYALFTTPHRVLMIAVLAVAGLAAVEELLIMLIQKNPHPDSRSIFKKIEKR